MGHSEMLRVEAYFDDELDAVAAADVERHIEQCAECQALLQHLQQARASLRRDLPYFRAPPALRAGVTAALDRESAPQIPPRIRWDRFSSTARAFWAGAVGGGLATALAAILAIVIWVLPLSNPLVDDLVGAHLRSLMSGHLIDVVSSDKHTVKPWFAGHADISPVVADFSSLGYRLIGARTDYMAQQRAAVVVYQHGPHVINVFTWAGNRRSVPRNSTRNGYRLIFWRSGDLEYCAVSDTAPDELAGLVRLLQGASRE